MSSVQKPKMQNLNPNLYVEPIITKASQPELKQVHEQVAKNKSLLFFKTACIQ